MEKYIPHHAYLLRLWPTKRDGVADYRVSLEDVATSECKNFPDLESLLAFLKTQRDNSVSRNSSPKALATE
jgi:hypothetical protein